MESGKATHRMLNYACTVQDLSCVIGSLFTELEPPCSHCAGDKLTISGTTRAGNKAIITINENGFYFCGNPADVEKIIKTRCNNDGRR